MEEDMAGGDTRAVGLLLLLRFLCALAHALGEVRDVCVCEVRKVE